MRFCTCCARPQLCSDWQTIWSLPRPLPKTPPDKPTNRNNKNALMLELRVHAALHSYCHPCTLYYHAVPIFSKPFSTNPFPVSHQYFPTIPFPQSFSQLFSPALYPSKTTNLKDNVSKSPWRQASCL